MRMRMRFLFLSLLIFVSCSDAQVYRAHLKGKTVETAESGSPAISGEGAFTMTDIVGENIPDLYYSYDIPQGDGHALMIYVHGWNGGGALTGAIDPDAITYLHSQGIGIIGVGMRGRNTDPSYANNGVTVEVYKDASALENYDVLATIRHFLANVVPEGQIDRTRIGAWVISGGGGAGYGLVNKFPGLLSTDVIWYGIPKYGTYDTDTRPTLTSWYTDNVNYEGDIQKAVAGAPKGSTGYAAGLYDEAFLSRDNLNGLNNSPDTKYHIYHDSHDGQVFDDLSNAAAAQLLANGQDYEYHYSTNFDYDHGNADLLVDKFNGTFGLQWVNDFKTVTRSYIGNSGTLRVNGYVIPVDENLDPIFSVWLKSYRKNVTASPRAGAVRNQGKIGAASLNYNISSNTYEMSLIKGNTSTGDQFSFVDITHGSDNVTAIISTSDVITLKPTTWSSKPLSLNYTWNVYHDFSTSTQYLLDDASKVSNAWDLTGNNNFCFQPTRASRASIVSGALDNGVLQYNGTAGTLAANVDFIQYPGEFTFVIKIDPDAASVGAVAEGLFGRAAGGGSLFQLGTFSGKITCSLDTETGTVLTSTGLPSFGPANSELGLQTWVIKRDASNDVYISMKGSSTISYNTGTGSKFGNISGTFDLRVLGSAAALTKQFAGKIYKFAAVNQAISDSDVTNLLNNF